MDYLVKFSKEVISSQSIENLKSVMSCQLSKLKCLLLEGIDLDGNIEDYIPIPQPKLHLICLWMCNFMTTHPIWSIICVSLELIRSTQKERSQDFHFAIPINGHTTQILVNNGPSILLPSSSNLIHGLILSLEQELPSGLLLNDISFLAILPSKMDYLVKFSKEVISSQSIENLKSVMSCQHPKLKHLLLSCMDFGGSIEDFIPILQLRLDLIYIWNCAFEGKISVSLLGNSVSLVRSTHKQRSITFISPL